MNSLTDLYEIFRVECVRIISRWTKNVDDSEDIYQDSMMLILNKYSDLKLEDKKFKALILKISWFYFMNKIKKANCLPLLEEPSTVDTSEEEKFIHRCIKNLSHEDQCTLDIVLLHENKIEGIKTGTYRQRKLRALRRLKKEIINGLG